MNVFRTLSLALGAASVAACASLPPATVALTPKSAQDYAADQSFAAPQAAWPSDAWWRAYGDAQLTGLIEEALASSPRMDEADARLRKARSLAGAAQTRLGPTISASGRAQQNKQSYNNGIPPDFVPQGYNDYGRVALDFRWELDFWGRNRAAVAAARSDAEAVAAEGAEARLVLSTAVADAYGELLRLSRQRALAARAAAARGETLGLVQQRVKQGLDSNAELRQAEAAGGRSRADLAELDEAIALARNQIAALLGEGPDRGLAITPPAGQARLAAFGLPPHLAVDLIGRRPDVVAARWRATAADRRVAGAKAAFYPNVDLVAFIGAEALHLDRVFESGSDVGSVGPALTLPIFDGGRLRAGLRGAQADRDAAVAVYDATLSEALRQVADATAGRRALGLRLEASRAALAADEEAFRLARLRYQGALSPYGAVLLAEQDLLSQRRAVADLESRAFVLDVALVRALGGGFVSAGPAA